MFKEMRFQTGEVREVAEAMKKGIIPNLEVQFHNEFEIFAGRLGDYGVFKAFGTPYDETARDRVKEPEFEFRAAFSEQSDGSASDTTAKLMYIDVYFELEPEETYDSIGEIL